MNRGSQIADDVLRSCMSTFNEAPIHESGKYPARMASVQVSEALQ